MGFRCRRAGESPDDRRARPLASDGRPARAPRPGVCHRAIRAYVLRAALRGVPGHRRPRRSGREARGAHPISSDQRVAGERLRESQLVTVPTADDVLESICQGRADAGLLVVNAFATIAMSDCPVGALRLRPVTGATYYYGVGANRDRDDAVRAAEMLSEAIGELAEDGTRPRSTSAGTRSWGRRSPRCSRIARRICTRRCS